MPEKTSKRSPDTHDAQLGTEAEVSTSAKLPAKKWGIFPSPASSSSVTKRKSYTRYFGLAFALAGTIVLAFLTFWDVLIKDDTKVDFVSIVGLGAMAIVTGFLTMFPAILATQRQSDESAVHRKLRDRLKPTLYFGMEEVVERWAELLLPGVQFKNDVGLDPALELELHVFLKVDGHYRIVASSSEESSNVRRLELMEDEGMIHTVYTRNSAVVAIVQPDFSARLFSCNGREIGDQPSLRPMNADKCNPELKWVYATPIFDKRSTHPYSNTTLGVFTIDGLNSTSNELYYKAEFRRLVESVALQLAPYVSAFNSLMEFEQDEDSEDEA